jgi:PilZ domain
MRSADLNRERHEALVLAASENRFAPRRKGQTPALIYVEGAPDGVPCLIKDMSTTGAKLELQQKWTYPFKGTFGHMDHIRLVVRADRVMYDCKIIRFKDGVMGVKFTSMPKPIAKVVR